MEVRLNGQTERYPDGTLLAEIVKAHEGETPFPAALALVNGSLKELHHKAKDGDVISFVTIDQGIGFEAYRRSCAMLFLTAVQNVLGEEKGRAILHFSVSLHPSHTPSSAKASGRTLISRKIPTFP